VTSAVPIHHYGHLDDSRKLRKSELYYELCKKKVGERVDDVDAWRELANEAGVIGRNEEAIAAWQRVVALAPRHPLAHLNLASLFVRLERHTEAFDAARRARELGPPSKEADYYYALGLVLHGRAAEGVSLLEALITREPGYAPAEVLLPLAECCAGKPEPAVAFFTQRGKRDPGFARAVADFVRKLVATGQRAGGAAVLEAAGRAALASDELSSLRALERSHEG
jgi:tetratricopeptide (TPR) repeat protein